MENMNAVTNRDLLLEIEDSVITLSLKINRAACVMQDLTENYFSLDLDGSKAEGQLWKLRAGYNEHTTKAEIVEDYIFGARTEINQLDKLVVKLMEIKKINQLEAS